MRGRTTFVIAHRLSTLALADEIVVLEGGRIAARGGHDELIEASDLYREIAERGLPDQVFLTRADEEREVAGHVSPRSTWTTIRGERGRTPQAAQAARPAAPLPRHASS